MEPASSQRLIDREVRKAHGPLSSAGATRMMLTPVQVSPAASARSMGAAPR